jgi:hypothetical protein
MRARRQRGTRSRFAIEMLAKGFADVVIIDPAQGGKAYTSSEFAKRDSSCAHAARIEGD